ncbi:MAG: DNA recombination protein RmuC [Marinifilaceae bacterium]
MVNYVLIPLLLILGFILGYLSQISAKRYLKRRINDLTTEQANGKILADKLQAEVIQLSNESIRVKETIRNRELRIQEQQQQIHELNATLLSQFKNMANEILEEKSQRFTEYNKQNIATILEPLNKEIADFKQRVNEVYNKEATERTVLERKIAELVQLNNQISKEANNLSQALKGNSKVQGDWGELILERILENSGLTKGREYFVQETMKDADNKIIKGSDGQSMRPDIIVVYPDNRKVIIDSKVSLTAYANYSGAQSDIERQHHLQLHIQSVRKHVDELANKNYNHYSNDVLDSVMMFMPNEGAYMVALQHDDQLWNYAYKKRVLLINPANLIVALKLTVDLWSREYQNRNALEIANRGQKMYEKCMVFLETFEEVGQLIDKTKAGYTTAYSRLISGQGSLVSQAVKLRDLGIKSQKGGRSIPQKMLREIQNNEQNSGDVEN